MRKIIFFLHFVCLIFCLVPLSFAQTEVDGTNKRYLEKPIHIFYEGLATMPALLGMVDMVQLPKDEKKVFAFHRFPNRSSLVDLKAINATEIPITAGEGYVLISGNYFLKEIIKILNEYPQSPIIVYTNRNNYQYFFDGFLKKVDPKRIRHVHLYEDGLGELFTSRDYFSKINYPSSDIQKLKDFYYASGKEIPSHTKMMMHYFFPATYHIYGLEQAKTMPELKNFFEVMKDASFKEVDFRKIRKDLSLEQREMLLKLIGFPKEKYEKLFSKGPVLIFLSGYHGPRGHGYYHAELNLLKQLMEKYPHFSFMYKPHPSYLSTNLKDFLPKVFPNLELIDAQLPYESFILAGLEPAQVSGYSSSLFYTLKKEQVEMYFPHESYRKGLALYKNIVSAKELNFKDFVPKEPFFFSHEIIYKDKKDYLILYNNKEAFIYGEKKAYSYSFLKDKLILKSSDETSVYEEKEGVYRPFSMKVFLLVHPVWRDVLYQKEGDVYCRLEGKKDCGVVTLTENEVNICWEKWGCETFKKQKNNIFEYDKEEEDKK